MIAFNKLVGFNSNRFVSEDHVFIRNEGCFFETKELASKNNGKTGNEVGLFFDTKVIEGREVFRELNTNIWD